MTMTFVYFDLDRTLVNHDRAQRRAVTRFYKKFQDLLDTSRTEFIERWRAVAERYWEIYHQGNISYREQKRERVRTVLNRDESELPDEEADEVLDWYLGHYKRACRLFPDAEACLRNLREHVELGILTNGGQELQHDKLQRTGIIDYFDPIVCSDEVGHAKPNKEIFDRACERADRSPERIIYIGDSVELDVRPANDFGMTGVWLNRENGSPSTSRPFHHLSSLEEFPDLVLEEANNSG